MDRTVRLGILASGSGSNAESIMQHFADVDEVEVAFVGCNRPPERAGVYERTRALGLETTHFSKADLVEGELLKMLEDAQIDWVILAGFLMHIPPALVRAYADRMLNIHPSLLPKFGGQGMYGMRVHEAVIHSGASESGMTVHWVTEGYDEGGIVFQASCDVASGDTPQDLANRVMELEHRYYPRIIAACIESASK